MMKSSFALALIALIGASVSDAAGTGSMEIKISNQELADNVESLDISSIEDGLKTSFNSNFPEGFSVTGVSMNVDGDTVETEVRIEVDEASDDEEAQKEINKAINEYRDQIKGSFQNILTDGSISADDISISAAAAVRVGLGAVAGAVLSMLMLA